MNLAILENDNQFDKFILAAILKCFHVIVSNPLTVVVVVVAAPIFFNHIIPDEDYRIIPLNSMEFLVDPFKFDRSTK